MAALDPRLIRVTITIDGRDYVFDQRLMIKANGTKYANPLQGEAQITIYNMSKANQDFILSKTSPYTLDPDPVTVVLEAGRESYGLAEIYRGNVVLSNMTQPPDIGIGLRCLTNNFVKGNIVTVNATGAASLKLLTAQAAAAMKLEQKFEATNKQIANAVFSGDASNIAGYLNSAGGVNVFVDGKFLVVKDAYVPLLGTLKTLSAESGMIGIPEFTEQGLRVKFLLDNRTTLGGALDIQSKIYPAINGRYVIFKLSFDIASRDTPFYYIAEAALFRETAVVQQ